MPAADLRLLHPDGREATFAEELAWRDGRRLGASAIRGYSRTLGDGGSICMLRLHLGTQEAWSVSLYAPGPTHVYTRYFDAEADARRVYAEWLDVAEKLGRTPGEAPHG